VTVKNKDLRERELAEARASLARAGIVLESVYELRTACPSSRNVVPVLLECVKHSDECVALREMITAIGCQECTLTELRELIGYCRTLRPVSFDVCTQLQHYETLRARRFRARPPTAEERQLAEYAVQQGWYLSYEQPHVRAPVRVYDPTFPDSETLEADADCEVVSMGLGNVLMWKASPELFEDTAELLLDRRLRFGREFLPEALAKSDKRRAPEVLMRVLNDPDIGARAMVQLGKLKHEPARPYIEKFLEHPIERVRREAKTALRRLETAVSRRATRKPMQFEEVLPEPERMLGARLVAAEGHEPQDVKGEVSGYVIGGLAQDEGLVGHTYSVELNDLGDAFHKLSRAFKGDLAGRKGRALHEEILEAEHEDWKAYKLKARVRDREETIWFHYFLDDPLTVDITIWGSSAFAERLESVMGSE
jgi:hypothetical protein